LNNLLATLSDEVILSQEDLTKLQAELQTLSEQLEKALKSLKESQTEIQKLSDSLASCQKLLDDCKKLLAQREAELEAWRTAAIISAAVAVLAILANFVPR
jgi:peptidoglycan hydrolase CwlO-like protein